MAKYNAAMQFGEDLPLLAEFARRMGTQLSSTAPTKEHGKVENVYFFKDGLGGYTRQSIIKSLAELNRLN